MAKYSILLGYFDRQLRLMENLSKEIVEIDVTVYEMKCAFAVRTQQLYTAIEDLFKQIVKSFENMGGFRKEILLHMNKAIPKTRPAVISTASRLLLDRIRVFCHFVERAYDCECSEEELRLLQEKIFREYPLLEKDLKVFQGFVQTLT
ncbi:MAG: hypothetical protein FJZ63_07550 [Chlamydiae bacterium]|nr:hypothetical protein [Chlamydiota bacterium]